MGRKKKSHNKNRKTDALKEVQRNIMPLNINKTPSFTNTPESSIKEYSTLKSTLINSNGNLLSQSNITSNFPLISTVPPITTPFKTFLINGFPSIPSSSIQSSAPFAQNSNLLLIQPITSTKPNTTMTVTNSNVIPSINSNNNNIQSNSQSKPFPPLIELDKDKDKDKEVSGESVSKLMTKNTTITSSTTITNNRLSPITSSSITPNIATNVLSHERHATDLKQPHKSALNKLPFNARKSTHHF